jgi:hypothetical protein
MTGTKRGFLWANLVLAAIVVLGVPIQAYFITAYATGAGEDALDAHGFIGGVIVHPAEALAFIAALVAYWGLWREVAFNFLLPLVGTIQLFFAPPDEDRASGWVHGFHGLLAIVVMVLAAIVVHRAMRRLRTDELAVAP